MVARIYHFYKWKGIEFYGFVFNFSAVHKKLYFLKNNHRKFFL
ncbi:hypothetical protein RIEPE_0069 [Candidatus Riesia pediculicola USDA]|uniref:Uncharacterized protein n=1 Tax=Riesia pediculicola (strain USDA) TaxID=515618 RepID=D4G7N1_RIEPU|nr:hypothetical protein RIEPE_0069 [Candidatus Riesia pediculicola USDA]